MPYQNENMTPENDTVHSSLTAFSVSLSKRAAAVVIISLMALLLMLLTAKTASAETRSLKLYYVHTGEKAEITFKRNGRFDQRGLQQLNNFLRDWRCNEPTKMDSRLFDLVWEVYRRVGASEYINIVSAYRSPNTNGMLRSRTKGVAQNSQHMLGKAMDFFIPGVKLETLRGAAMQLQVGGVGFYPTSGSPFVHLDVGGVRAWPRMSRDELVRLFPNGNTMHLPSDGKPLPGYDQALADYKKRLGEDSNQITSMAGGPISGPTAKKKNLLAMLFGGGSDKDEDSEEISTPAARPTSPARPAAPVDADKGEEAAPVMVASAQPLQAPAIAAPVPQSRPAFRQNGAVGGLANALYLPGGLSAAQNVLQAALPAQQNGNEIFADLQQYTIPIPTMLGPRGMKGDAKGSVLTAFAGPINPTEMGVSSVPVPAHRPVFSAGPMSTSLLAPQVQPDPVQAAAANTLDAQARHLVSGGQQVSEGSQALTPELVAELAKRANYSRSAETAIPVPVRRPVQVAFADPKASGANGRTIFGDGFDAPKLFVQPTPSVKAPIVEAPARAPEPAAIANHSLTGDVLAQWALGKGKDEASVKVPRVVSRAFSAENVAISDNFKSARPVMIDPNRFSTPAKP